MSIELHLSAEQAAAQARALDFARAQVAPFAAEWDRAERLPRALVSSLAEAGLLAAAVPVELGGPGLDAVSLGLVHAAVGAACSSARSVLTVHSMVLHAVARWGSAEQRARWLPDLLSGRTLGAFALSEPEVGSDAQSVQMRAEKVEGGYRLSGTKTWISFGQLAELLLVFAKVGERPTAFLVERASPHLATRPITGLMGMRASMLATLDFEQVYVPEAQRVGGEGFGFSVIASSALDLGRFSVAWGALGVAEACVAASLDHARTRRQFGAPLGEQPLVRRLLTDMATDTRAARLLCLEAAWLRGRGSPEAVTVTQMAKYLASRTAYRVAGDTAQLHGALGVSAERPVERWLRDAKINEIVEGSSEIQQLTIAKALLLRAGRS